MKIRIADYLSDLKLGEFQSFRNMGVVPLFTSRNGGVDYLLMKDALERNLIQITELGSQGTVPELQVVNRSEEFILLLDGEEVIGAKQNRVLNASILLAPKSETVLPVSCSEQGRWSAVSPHFSPAGEMMAAKARARKVSSVRESVAAGAGYASDQGQVWEDIRRMKLAAAAVSPTGAMRDVYEAKTEDLKEHVEAFPIVPEQKGALILIDGKTIGLDVLSRVDAYAEIHPQLIRSYSMDALLEREKEDITPSAVEDAWEFLGEAKSCREEPHESVGAGEDCSLEHAHVVGSALVHEESVLHLVLFRTEPRTEERRFASYRLRRRSHMTEFTR